MDNLVDIISGCKSNMKEEIIFVFPELKNEFKRQIFFLLLHSLLEQKINEEEFAKYIEIMNKFDLSFSSIIQIKEIIIMLHKKNYHIVSKILLSILKIENFISKLNIFNEKLEQLKFFKLDNKKVDDYYKFVEITLLRIIKAFYDRKFICFCLNSFIETKNNNNIISINEITNRLFNLVDSFGINFLRQHDIEIIRYSDYMKLNGPDKLNFYIKITKKLNGIIMMYKSNFYGYKREERFLSSLFQNFIEESATDSTDNNSLLFDQSDDDDDEKYLHINYISNNEVELDIDFDIDDKETSDIIDDFLSEEESDDEEINIIDSMELIE